MAPIIFLSQYSRLQCIADGKKGLTGPTRDRLHTDYVRKILDFKILFYDRFLYGNGLSFSHTKYP